MVSEEVSQSQAEDRNRVPRPREKTKGEIEKEREERMAEFFILKPRLRQLPCFSTLASFCAFRCSRAQLVWTVAPLL